MKRIKSRKRGHVELAIKRKRNGNPAWKGNKVKIHSLHTWINDNFIRPNLCESCGKKVADGGQFDWSNKDHKYSRDRKDWQYMCRKCHMEFDIHYLGRTMPWTNIKWSRYADACIECGTTKIKHGARGKCRKCYEADRNAKAH